MGFDGKWSLTDGTGVAAYFDAIKSPEEYKNKLRELVELSKKDSQAYVEELTVTATTLHRIVVVNGEKKKDSGEVAFGVELEAKAADGRPAKVKLERNSDTKFTRYETGDGFSTVTTFQVTGDTLTVTASGNGATSVTTYKKL
jgi:hypothetical protein